MVENIKNNIIKIDNFDKRSVVEFMIDKDIKKKDFLVSPILLKNENNLQILPLSSKSFTKYFRGEKGVKYIVQSAKNNQIGSFENGRYDTTAVQAPAIHLGLDAELQAYGEKLMQKEIRVL